MNIKRMQFKKWGYRACLRVSEVLKWRTFTGCALKIRIVFKSLGYLKDAKFYLESKA